MSLIRPKKRKKMRNQELSVRIYRKNKSKISRRQNTKGFYSNTLTVNQRKKQ